MFWVDDFVQQQIHLIWVSGEYTSKELTDFTKSQSN